MATIFITGASKGIGESFTELAAKHEHTLIISARRLSLLNDIKTKLLKQPTTKATIITYKIDVTDKENVKKTIDEIIQKYDIDVLINNAGLALGKENIHETPLDYIDTMIDTNVKGLLYITKAILPSLLKQPHPLIINIGSIAGIHAYGSGTVYCATKAAVRFISDGLRIELVNTPVRVTNIQPGLTETDFSLVRFQGNKEKANAIYDSIPPLTGKDIADAILYVINTPENVQISEMTIMPKYQANVFIKK